MSILQLPTELILFIIDGLEPDRDLNRFTQTCSKFHNMLRQELYRRNAQNHDFSKKEPWRQKTALISVSLNRRLTDDMFKEALLATNRKKKSRKKKSSKDDEVEEVDEHGTRLRDYAFFSNVLYRHQSLVEIQLSMDKGLDLNSSHRTLYEEEYGVIIRGGIIFWTLQRPIAWPITAMLLAAGKINLNQNDSRGESAISYAVSSRNLKALQALLDHGATLNSMDRSGGTPLIVKALRNEYHNCIIELLLATGKVDLTARTAELGWTPLHHVVYRSSQIRPPPDNLKTINMILEANKKAINLQSSQGETALLRAVRQRDASIVRLLLATEGIDVNIPNHDRLTPLDWAIGSGYDDLIHDLVQAGAKTLSYKGVTWKARSQVSFVPGNRRFKPGPDYQNGYRRLYYNKKQYDRMGKMSTYLKWY